MKTAREWQFDGLVGPTHNYAGLAFGNMAATHNAGLVSNPKSAALQGLAKMRFVRDLGVPQAFIPPHFRPVISELKRNFGVHSLAKLLETAKSTNPRLLASIYSSSYMWTANMATVTPSADAGDGKMHFTPANLISHYHRGMESDFSLKLLHRIFHNTRYFTVHNYLEKSEKFGDEGAANHMRINHNHGDKSINVFVYGDGAKKNSKNPSRFPARQKRLASESVALAHQLNAEKVIFLQQRPESIDQGIFHNDVIAMNSNDVFIAHEDAFIREHQNLMSRIVEQFPSFRYREVKNSEFSVVDAVSTYLFNSQLLKLPDGKFVLVAPAEVGNHAGGATLVAKFLDEQLIDQAHYLDVRESMRNGGGPACLRLRISMNSDEEKAIHPGILLTDEKFTLLIEWVKTYYRDKLSFEDLSDPKFVNELVDAYRALEDILGMPGLYDEAIAAI